MLMQGKSCVELCTGFRLLSVRSSRRFCECGCEIPGGVKAENLFFARLHNHLLKKDAEVTN